MADNDEPGTTVFYPSGVYYATEDGLYRQDGDVTTKVKFEACPMCGGLLAKGEDTQ